MPATTEAKPMTLWAFASLAIGIVAWLAAAPLPFIDYGTLAGATAGVGLAGPFLLGLLSALLSLMGLIFGIVAVIRAASGRVAGGGLAWAAVALNVLLVTAYAALIGLMLVGSDALQRLRP